jgi:hypothetical protein
MRARRVGAEVVLRRLIDPVRVLALAVDPFGVARKGIDERAGSQAVQHAVAIGEGPP